MFRENHVKASTKAFKKGANLTKTNEPFHLKNAKLKILNLRVNVHSFIPDYYKREYQKRWTKTRRSLFLLKLHLFSWWIVYKKVYSPCIR